jgi:hypothetical protein
MPDRLLDLVAAGTESGEALEPLDLPIVVVMPDFVAFDRPAAAPPTADLAAVTGLGGHLATQPVPQAFGTWLRTLLYQQVDGTSSTQAGLHSPIITTRCGQGRTVTGRSLRAGRRQTTQR